MNIGFIDQPLDKIDNEWLDVAEHIESLSEFIANCQTPMTIAIQGDWGTGKTSMMKLVQINIQNQGIETVWFNTWQFSQFNMQNDVPIVLLLELMQTVGYEKGAIDSLRNLAGRLGKGVAVLATGVFGGEAAATAMDKSLTNEPVNPVLQIKKLKDGLEKAIKARLQKLNKDRIVIFLDDLDRMTPGKAVELLEVMKNFLDIKGCVYVLAVDYGVVSRGVKAKYGADMDELKGRSFFDKIIQLPFNLPVGQYNIRKYIKNLLNVSEEDVPRYVELAYWSVGTNPRTLKRMANILNLLEIVASKHDKKSLEQPEFKRLLFAVLCLQMAYEPVYAQFLSDNLKADILDEKAEKRINRFSAALDKCPGKKEDVANRLERFFQALAKALPDSENDFENSPDILFSSVLHMSGITASGGQAPLQVTDAQKDTFDPLLMAKLKLLKDELIKKYGNLWEIIERTPYIEDESVNELDIPVLFGNLVILFFKLDEEGINIGFYSDETAAIIKKPFKEMLTSIAPSMIKSTKYNGRSGYFIEYKEITWEVATSRTTKEDSEARFEQVKKLLETKTADLLPALEKHYDGSVPAIESINKLVHKISTAMKPIFPAEDGWEIEIGNITKFINPESILLSIRKSLWKEDYTIRMGGEKLGCNTVFMGFYHENDENYAENKANTAIFNKWQKVNEEKVDGGLVNGNEYYSIWAYLPNEIANWTTGSIFENDFSYELDEKSENTVIDTLCSYAKRFKAIEKELDNLAMDE